MSGFGYLVAAYVVTIIGLGGYLASLISRSKRAARAHKDLPSSGS